MDTITSCLLFLCGFSLATPFTSMSSFKRMKDGTQTTLFPSIMNEILSGPLKGRPVIIVFQKGLSMSILAFESSLRDIAEPVFIQRLPQNKPDEEEEVEEHLELHKTRNDHSSELAERNSVMVILVSAVDEYWWPFWYPLASWSPSGLVILSLSPACATQLFLKSPLALRTPSAALLCPYAPRSKEKDSRESLKTVYLRYKLWTNHPYASGRTLVDLGIWNPENFHSWNDLFPDRFQDMTSKRVNILASSIDRPFYYKREDGSEGGQTYLIVNVLSQWLGYTYFIKSGSNVNYSIIHELVETGENDIMINYATPTLERNEKFLLSAPYSYEGFGIMLGIPPPLPQWQNIIYPFSWLVWGFIAVSLLVTALTFHLLYHQSEKSIITNFITIMQSLLSNPLPVVPEGWRTRCFLLPWWLVAWLIDMSYTCNLIAILTVPVFPTKIKTAHELAESDFSLCMVDYGEFVPEALKTSTQPVLKALGDKMEMVPLQEHMPEIGEELCVEKVLAGTHAHTEAYPYMKTLYGMFDLNPKVYEVKERLYPSYLSILVHKYAPWKYKFDIGMERLREAGLLQKWYNEGIEEFQGKPGEASSSLRDLKPLSLSHLQGSFLLLSLGLFVALLVLAGEILLPFKE